MPKILIGADIVPTVTNQYLFEAGNIDSVIDEKLLRLLRDADYRIFNLEVPLTDTILPIEKQGPNLIASTKSVHGIKQLGVDFVTLANNHILDQGTQGLQSTIEQLKKFEIAYCGAGSDIVEAQKPYIFLSGGKTIGIYCCAEHEFTIATENVAGANPFDPMESLDHLAKLREKCDFVICLYHGGKEHYRYPSPLLQKTCRKMVEKGADLVVCQHSHCIGCEEKFLNGTIVYGQGNFWFDYSDSVYWQTALLIEVKTDDSISVNYHPICKKGNGVLLAEETAGGCKILKDFYMRSEDIKNKDFVAKKFSEFCKEFNSLLVILGGVNTNSILYRGLNKLSKYHFGSLLAKCILSRKKRLMLKNFIECEAWREVVLELLEKGL